MQSHRRHILRLAAGALALPAIARTAAAESFPSRPVTIIVPFAPGALNDIVARQLSDAMGKALGQPVIIENVTGADGTIATNRVVRATPDGYTLVIGNWNTQVANGLIYSLQYDMVKDFEPVMPLPAAPMVLVAKKATPATDLKGFIAWLKDNPDKASVGTAGVGSPPHMLALLFRNRTETRFSLIPYRGAGPAMQDVIAGQIDATFITVAPALPQINAGSIKAFGLTAQKRVAAAPDLPTMGESGLPDFYFSVLGRALRAARHAQGHPPHDRRGGRRRHERSAGSAKARRAGLRDAAARSADAAGARRAASGRAHQVGADHQASRRQSRVRFAFAAPSLRPDVGSAKRIWGL